MLLQIEHKTEYRYDAAPNYGVMRLRLLPRSVGPQRVMNWNIQIDGAEKQVSYRDHLGNDVWLISTTGGAQQIVVTASGQIETREANGVYGRHRSLAPLWLFTRPTELTMPGEHVRALVEQLPGAGQDGLALAHRLMGLVADMVAYDVEGTHPSTTAEQALERGTGVCQDHAHIMIAVARQLGIPARYVSGYLRMDDRDDQTATHAWAELHLDGLGWVGFDASNRISPDERYARIASGRDYSDAAPVEGIRYGNSDERMNVQLRVAVQ